MSNGRKIVALAMCASALLRVEGWWRDRAEAPTPPQPIVQEATPPPPVEEEAPLDEVSASRPLPGAIHSVASSSLKSC